METGKVGFKPGAKKWRSYGRWEWRISMHEDEAEQDQSRKINMLLYEAVGEK